MKFDCVDRLVSWLFSRLGYHVGLRAGYFVIVPLLVSVILATGFQRVVYVDNPEYLFSPVNGRSRSERRIVESLFPMNTTESFDFGRATRMGRFARVLLDTKDGGTVLREHVYNEMVYTDAIIQNITITWNKNTYRYKDLCAKDGGSCYNNDMLDFKQRIKDIENRTYLLKYPIMLNRVILKRYNLLASLGGVSVDESGFVEKAKAFSLFYPLDIDVRHGEERAELWEKKFLVAMENMELEYVNIGYFVSDSLESELEKNTQAVTPYFSVTLIVMLSFSVMTCMMSDWVRSKPWLGILGCISSVIAVAAAFGLIIYCGFFFIGINFAAPFLMIGIGMDDTFVLLAAWRRTDLKKPIPERMAETYSEAAVSITITSLTNFLSFLIGVLTPFPAVQIFCIYTAVAVLFTYVWHISFFGGCMAICGYAEQRNLHSVFCVPATPKSVAISGNKSVLFRLLCTGGINKDDPDNLVDNKEHALMVFFRDSFGKALSYVPIKILIIVCFLVYLIIGIWGCTQVKEGLERHKLSKYDSYSIIYYRMDDTYFRKYPFRIQIVITDELNYEDPKIQEAVENMLQKFENEEFSAGPLLTESWLRAYLQFQKDDLSFFLLDGFNLTKREDFIEALRSVFFRLPQTDKFKNDLLLNEDGTSIIASRFLVQTQDIRDSNQEKAMVIKLREIADNSPFNVTVFQQFFIFWDQYILVRETSIQAISVAAAVMMVISLIFIPKPICALWVAFSIISIEIGVIGYMSLWKVNLDSISMINLIMCIGFSVDYSAHISYAFISSEKKTADDRIRSALHSLGMPILQGSLSTILGIISLSFAPSYIFLAFFKTIFLVILFGALHGLLLLPILLSISDHCCSSKKGEFSHTLYHSHKPSSSTAPAPDNGNIIIPRPSHPNIAILGITNMKASQQIEKGKSAKMDYGKIFLETSSSNSSADKDLGIGTSGEESSEGSWKEKPLDPNSRAHEDTRLIRYPYFPSGGHEEHSNPAFQEDETVQLERTPSAPASRDSSRMSLYHVDNNTGLFNVRHSEEQSIRNSGERLSSVSRTRDTSVSLEIDQPKRAHEQQGQHPL